MTPRFKAPTEEQVREVVRKIPTLQLRRAFFEGLKNPLWVEPLAKQGVFSNPPEPEVADDGLIRDVYWPEIEYLVRVAKDVPEAVVDVLLKLGKSNNAWVRRGAIAIGATIPPDQAARLQPLIKEWKSTGLGWRTDPRDIVGFAVNLFEGRQTDFGKWLARLVFEPVAGKDGRRPRAMLEEYWYESGLSRLVAVLEAEHCAIVLRWLTTYERISGKLTKSRDITYFSRESIRKRDDEHGDIEQALIDAVRDLAIKAMLVDAEGTRDSLLKRNMILGRKIALFSLAEAIRQLDISDQQMERLVGVARGLLFDADSFHYSCRIDYAELARAVATVSEEMLSELPEFFDERSMAEGDRNWARLVEDGVETAEASEQVKESVDRWKHLWLSSIGAVALPPSMQTTLADLDARYGVIDAPLEPTPIVTSWYGPNSPLTLDEMAAMSPVELVNHLESWHDSGHGWGPEPSHEGQGRELTALLASRPKALAGVGDLVGRLRPTYLRAILNGWQDAAKAGVEPDWPQLLEVLGAVLAHGEESPFPTEGGRGDDDPDFRYAKQGAVRLLEQLVKPNARLTPPDDTMRQLAELLIGSFSDEVAWHEYIGTAGGDMDAFTTSLNWQWPIGIRGLIYLMAHGKDASWYQSAKSTLTDELARDDMHGAAHAVVGEGLGRLLLADPEWVETIVPEVFGSDVELSVQQQIALTTAITAHHYNAAMYGLLSSPMIGAIRAKEPVVAGWRTQTEPLGRIGDWVINAVIRGHSTEDAPLAQEFFSAVPPKVRGDAMGHLGWAFMHAQTVDEPIRDRMAGLWDSRVAHVEVEPSDRDELSGFCWFVKSGKFPVEWWLPRLKQALELCPEVSSETHMIGKELASAAALDPRATFEILRSVLDGREESDIVFFELTREAVAVVIARAVSSDDERLRQDAVVFMNQLGERGHFSLEGEVAKHL
ncbi:hypothetical protein H7J86_21390 [Mycobacterium hackensackense]|uniref:hypothetical protein n=1 Tax=Mycobacterium hackensackense TaxID=228909 RepID=UPI002265BE02|nr:hypothetical protein [Mycobacterium hackensackense]MCV7254719.1 hypothetical protein [Mycobacterium hackensackense]